MSVRDLRGLVLGLIVAGLMGAGLSGCGGIGGAPVPVTGGVSLNGTPLPFARIVFHPQELGGREVAAVTDLRGRYDIRDGDRIGLPPGAYTVTVYYYVSSSNRPYRPEPLVDFSGEGLTQLLPEKYSSPAQTELSALVLDPEADKPNVFIFDLEGDDVPLPEGVRRHRQPVGPPPEFGDEPPVDPGSPSRPFLTTDMIVYGGAGVIFIAVVAAILFVFRKRRAALAGADGPTYQYAGEMEEEEEAMPAPVAAPPRRKKKKKKKKVRKQATADSAVEAPTPVPPPTAAADEPDSEGSPFPVLDEGMDDDDVAAAFLASDEETVPAPKKAASSERELAQWMLSVGGFVKVQGADKKGVTVKKSGEFPQGDFQLHGAFFEGVEDFGDDELAKLKKLPHLDTLDLISTSVTDEGLAVLEKLPSIRTLALSRTGISDKGLEHLTALPNLKVLLLYRTKITDAGLEHLKKLTKLKTIELKRTEVSESGAKELQEALPECKVIV